MTQKYFYPVAGVLRPFFLLILGSAFAVSFVKAQDSTSAPAEKVVKKKLYTKNTFEGNYIIDNQTVMVPIKGTFEFDINHRFGTTNNGISSLYGIFSGANIRLGFSYVALKDLQVGFGVNNHNTEVDGSIKYAILKQRRDHAMPVSVTYYGNMSMDTRKKSSSVPIVSYSDRFAYFNQLIVARKITEAFSAQASFNYTHFNNVPGYYDESNKIQPAMKNDHFSFSIGGRYKITKSTSIIVNYDQPLTQHPMNNPHPNISFGLEMNTSGHDFQIFAGNYGYTLPQDNNFLNQNDYTKGQFVIGFNISRLWNF